MERLLHLGSQNRDRGYHARVLLCHGGLRLEQKYVRGRKFYVAMGVVTMFSRAA